MATEMKVNEILENAGFEPLEDKAIIVAYAPANLSDRLCKLFANEFYVLQLCRESIVLIPFKKFSSIIKKEVALELPFRSICGVEVKEELLNYRVEIQLEQETIALSVQQKELSDLRMAGLISQKGLLLGAGWHKENLDGTLAALKALAREQRG